MLAAEETISAAGARIRDLDGRRFIAARNPRFLAVLSLVTGNGRTDRGSFP